MSYLDYAYKLGYKFVETLDHTSSAGDWSFIVSKTGKVWRIMWQTNNYPRAGYSYSFGDRKYRGTAEEVFAQILEDECLQEIAYHESAIARIKKELYG